MRTFLRLTALAGAVALAACSDGATDPDASALTRAEALGLAAGIGASSSDVLLATASAGGASLSSGAAAPFTVERTLSVEAPCPLGGMVSVDGTVALSWDGETESGSIDAEARMVHADCGVRVEGGTLTLDGRPELTVASEFAWDGGEQSLPLRVTHAGGVAWKRDSGEAGTCEVSLVAVTDLATRRRTVEGTLCGFRVDEETTWTPRG